MTESSHDAAVDASALQLAEAFAIFGPAYTRWSHANIQPGDPSYARIRVLTTLHCEGAVMMSRLSDALMVTRRNITTLVDGLEADGLVRRVAHPSDRRATLVELTALGAQMAADISVRHATAVAHIFTVLSAADQAALLGIVAQLMKALQRESSGLDHHVHEELED